MSNNGRVLYRTIKYTGTFF